MTVKETCCICGKELHPHRKQKLSVNYDNANGVPIGLNEAPAHGQWGFLPIGSACATTLAVAVWKER
jgi:hypothetical protein